MQKARSHTIVAIGYQERRFEVRLTNNKFGCANELRTHEVKIRNETWATCECTCNKPKLLHLPCSHVLAACGQLGMDSVSFVSPFFLKESVDNTWTGELLGFRSMGNFNTVRGDGTSEGYEAIWSSELELPPPTENPLPAHIHMY